MKLLFAVAALLGAAAWADASPDRARTPQLEVKLIADHAAAAPGGVVDLGLDFALQKHWHVYWRNAGDSGEPPRVEWQLPDGFAADEIRWPVPERIRVGPLLNYGYTDHVLLPVRIDVPRAARPGTKAHVRGKVSWLVCRAEECIPGRADLALDLPIAAKAKLDDRVAAAFTQARDRLPKPLRATFVQTPDGRRITLHLRNVARVGEAQVDFFPLEKGQLADTTRRVSPDDTGALVVEIDKGELAPPVLERAAGLALVESHGRSEAYTVDAIGAAAPASTASMSGKTHASLPLALLLAFAGGVILNLMPCVFPVLSLKVLSFIEQAGHDPRRVRVHGWVFTLGVLASFWILAGALLALRAGGESLGWGFQLQSPAFLAGLCAVLLLLALSLSGVFELGLSLTGVTSAHIEESRGYAASFWTGALATVIATPCTAPFMGSALGYALTQPAYVALLVFTALGLGMALPYLVLSYAPGLLRRLPRPGPWMEAFRQFMAFPLYATVLWLLFVFSRQTSDQAMWRLAVALLLLAMGAWAWGVAQRLRSRGRLATAFAAAFAAGALVIGFSAATHRTGLEPGAAAAETDGFWQPWSPERVASLRASNKPVFVNFTADWCLSCQVNERVVFASDEVRELFREHGVTALKADWTNEDARIAETLATFGRDGVPLYVYYPAGDAPPRILPQVPTHGSLSEAFASVTKEKNES